MRLMIFGAGNYGSKYIQKYVGNNQIVAFVDNYNEIGYKFGHEIIKPEQMINYEYDKVIICLADKTSNDVAIIESVYNQLIENNVPIEKIMLQNFQSFEMALYSPRTKFAEDIAKDLKNVNGAVAECGVFRGNFAGVLNSNFEDKKLYLFDTFSGFDDKDINEEKNDKADEWLSNGAKEMFTIGSEILSLLRCPYKQNVEIRKGFVPETFVGLEDEKFCFVNLDMDLYQPTVKAPNFFYERLEYDGMILLHDYFHPKLPGIKQAVDEFIASQPLYSVKTFPIGDGISMGLIKTKIN